jgi:hypothetical protein
LNEFHKPERKLNTPLSMGSRRKTYSPDQQHSVAFWRKKMLNRLFVIIFLAIVLGGPFIALLAITDGTKAFGNEIQQKSVCLMTGTGCGNGNLVVTVASRI